MTNAPLAPEATTRRPRRAAGRSSRDLLLALPWIAPSLVLIFGVVLFPAAVMFYNSTRDISQSGVDRGPAGFDNYLTLLEFDPIWGVLGRTLVWVVAVVLFTVLLSLALAQLLNKAFPGRQLVRMAVIVPWAASVVMTTLVVYYGLDPFYGIINEGLVQLGILDTPYGFTKNATSAFAWSIGIAVFVSLPFTTYTILAGLQTIPADVFEAAKIDGAGRRHTYFAIVLPQLRSALAVAILINIINVFNSLPILKVMTGSIPGYDADTVMTLIFKYIQTDHRIDVASALSVVGFLMVLVIVALYVRIVKPMREV
ncbi:multiple sugar transport system permease protein [Conyzicola lurida]|uniref:Multiple sugar transport system permease protein n=1 Tax=Conyzicola lurida TaxID=1172621 RepID=A0A841AFA8_9MICO|nr:sugar ABC transporter permease [Conyzicola lurida]MBB5841927.1 multiple sugar transport system permease protein [Conyzicola lurida]